jgi:hypothetical protein
MFMHAVVVKGYPILARSDAGIGMEVPLNTMAGLTRADCLDQFGEAMFLKGFWSLLIPIKKAKDSIIRHVVYNADEHRNSYVHNVLQVYLCLLGEALSAVMHSFLVKRIPQLMLPVMGTYRRFSGYQRSSSSCGMRLTGEVGWLMVRVLCCTLCGVSY